MGYAERQVVMTAEEFLDWEAGQTERHDFVEGEVFAMAGAEDRHVTVSLNIAIALRQHLSGTPCRTFMADMKVAAAANNHSFFYPDVVVTCSAADRQSPLVKREPTLIAEVLSRSTAAYDLGSKFAHYRQIPTLREIAFIDLDARRADVYRRGADGLWVLHPFDAGMDMQLASIDLTITAAALFADVDEAFLESGTPGQPLA
ncbi:MAG: Uma2 family endonuclease [Burkholderiaceae bacterium]|jgi:Uma2 family endonuclease|nr:Uma2 family endonuclease [Burkholderiaceae bacterium]